MSRATSAIPALHYALTAPSTLATQATDKAKDRLQVLPYPSDQARDLAKAVAQLWSRVFWKFIAMAEHVAPKFDTYGAGTYLRSVESTLRDLLYRGLGAPAQLMIEGVSAGSYGPIAWFCVGLWLAGGSTALVALARTCHRGVALTMMAGIRLCLALYRPLEALWNYPWKRAIWNAALVALSIVAALSALFCMALGGVPAWGLAGLCALAWRLVAQWEARPSAPKGRGGARFFAVFRHHVAPLLGAARAYYQAQRGAEAARVARRGLQTFLGLQTAPTPTRVRRRPTHLASELEVFWTGKGGSFALSFLLLSFSARAILMMVAVSLL